MITINKDDILNEVKNITIKDFHDGYWVDDITYVNYLEISEKLKELLKHLILDDNVEIFAEYWLDDDTFHYSLMSEYEMVSINNLIECEHLNNLFISLITK